MNVVKINVKMDTISHKVCKNINQEIVDCENIYETIDPTLTIYNQCLENKCTCQNGNPKKGMKCKINNQENCHNCHDGHLLFYSNEEDLVNNISKCVTFKECTLSGGENRNGVCINSESHGCKRRIKINNNKLTTNNNSSTEIQYTNSPTEIPYTKSPTEILNTIDESYDELPHFSEYNELITGSCIQIYMITI